MDGLHSPFPPTSPYPPLENTWNRLRAWLSREYPELGDTLNWGMLPQDMADLELQFGFALPTVVRESYLCCDGQEAESAAGCSEGLFFGLTLLPLESVLEEWRFWREVDEDPTTGANAGLRSIQQSVPPNYVRKAYSERGWIPLIADKAGNYVGIDLHPDEAGTAGQVIVFGRDFDTKVVLWRGDGATGWAKWLDSFAEELESGEGFEIGNNDTSEDSEDDVGYDGYFYNGNAPGQGDSSATGTAGLRYTGEYRGWNVLEVWADRSFRRWLDAGLIPTDTLTTPGAGEESKTVREHAYLGAFTLTPNSRLSRKRPFHKNLLLSFPSRCFKAHQKKFALRRLPTTEHRAPWVGPRRHIADLRAKPLRLFLLNFPLFKTLLQHHRLRLQAAQVSM